MFQLTTAYSGEAIEGENPIFRGSRLPSFSTHVIVQFDQPPPAHALAALTARGAVVLQYVPDNAVLVPRTTQSLDVWAYAPPAASIRWKKSAR